MLKKFETEEVYFTDAPTQGLFPAPVVVADLSGESNGKHGLYEYTSAQVGLNEMS